MESHPYSFDADIVNITNNLEEVQEKQDENKTTARNPDAVIDDN